jgi:hypothetical protein
MVGRMFIRTVPLLILFVLVAPATATAGPYRDLCVSAPGSCDYTGPDAPAFDGLVCRDAAVGVTAKGSAPCPSGSTTYHLEYGELIDASSGTVAGYMPLDSACSVAGLCVAGPAPTGTASVAICCEFGTCVPISQVLCNGPSAAAYMCDNGVCNLDGTITCFEGEEF